MANNLGTEVTAMPINIGIAENDRTEIAEGLSRLLADTFTLYLKTHNFHWNVTGPMFRTLHIMFEEQYNEHRPQHHPCTHNRRNIVSTGSGNGEEIKQRVKQHRHEQTALCAVIQPGEDNRGREDREQRER